jgi:UDP-2,4-diacetamido-2,4,6-trideoxy-beta-L-altropyranose hydrolase
MKVAFRADASTRIGTGHIMRCLALADALAARGATCLFVCRTHTGHLHDLIVERGHRVTMLDAAPADPRYPSSLAHADWTGTDWHTDAHQTRAALAAFEPDWLVLDHYGLDARWEDVQREVAAHLLVIDDLADRPHSCDVLLDHNWYGEGVDARSRYRDRVSSACECLLGPQFALLRPEFAQLRDQLPQRDGLVRRVLVFMGGADAGNETAKVLRALTRKDLRGLALDVVIGRSHPDPEGIAALVAARPDTVLHVALPSLAGLMARADMMVGAGGSTNWERMCLGLPTVVISVAENQTETNRALHDAGYVCYLGESRDIGPDDLADAISTVIANPDTLINMSARGRALSPGRGANAVAARLCAPMAARAGQAQEISA